MRRLVNPAGDRTLTFHKLQPSGVCVRECGPICPSRWPFNMLQLHPQVCVFGLLCVCGLVCVCVQKVLSHSSSLLFADFPSVKAVFASVFVC